MADGKARRMWALPNAELTVPQALLMHGGALDLQRGLKQPTYAPATHGHDHDHMHSHDTNFRLHRHAQAKGQAHSHARGQRKGKKPGKQPAHVYEGVCDA